MRKSMRKFMRAEPSGPHRRRIRSAGIAAAVAVTAAAAAQTAVTVPAQASEQLTCPVGYVCLQSVSGPIVMIAQGERRTFPGGLPVDGTANSTRLGYCVTATPYSYALRAGSRTTHRHTVHAVAPNDHCVL